MNIFLNILKPAIVFGVQDSIIEICDLLFMNSEGQLAEEHINACSWQNLFVKEATF